ncbi:MAG: hypothetical protein ACR2FS_07720 [Phormidesmis sp.]
MRQSPPAWLTRDAIACHPQRRLIFEPLRLRLEQTSQALLVHYAPDLALPVSECRLAEVPDLLSQEMAVYLAGQRYDKAVSGQRIRLSRGEFKYLIQLARDDCAIASLAQAFNGEIVILDDDQTARIDQLFKEPSS